MSIIFREAVKQTIIAIEPFIAKPNLDNLLSFARVMHGFVNPDNLADKGHFQVGTTIGQYCLLNRLCSVYCGNCPLRSQGDDYSKWCMSWYAKHWYGEEYWSYKKLNKDGRHIFPRRRSRITKKVLAEFHTRAIHYKLAAEAWLVDGKVNKVRR